MLKNEKGITLAMLTLSVAILLMIAFTTILLVFDSGVISESNLIKQNNNNNNESMNSEASQVQEINRTEVVNNAN